MEAERYRLLYGGNHASTICVVGCGFRLSELKVCSPTTRLTYAFPQLLVHVEVCPSVPATIIVYQLGTICPLLSGVDAILSHDTIP